MGKIELFVKQEIAMKDYILLLPIIFIFHDMEEIIGFEWFFRKNPDLFDRFPKVMKAYRNFTTAGMALAVYEEFIPFFGLSLIAYYFPCSILNAIWLGIFISFTAHLLVHIGQTLYIRKYIPSFITSTICLPLSIAIIFKCASLMTFSAASVICIFAAFLFMMVNLRIAHCLMHYFNKKTSGKAEA